MNYSEIPKGWGELNMLAKFEFNLPEETEEYLLYHKAPRYSSFIDRFGMWLRDQSKYHSKHTDVYEEWCKMLADEGLSE